MTGDLGTRKLQHLIRPPKVEVRRPPLLALLHGQGSNEREMISLFGEIDDRFLVASLRAPFPHGPGTFTWFTDERSGLNPIANLVQVEFSRQAVLDSLRDLVAAYRAEPRHVFLLGFDQGAVLGLSLMLTSPQALAGVAALSGYVLPEIRSLAAPTDKLIGFPVLLTYSSREDIYPVGLTLSTLEMLTRLPVALEFKELETGHYLTPECLEAAQLWLANQLDDLGVYGLPELPAYTLSLGAAQIKVTNLDRSVAFYMSILGLKLTERTGNAFAFLSSGSEHHTLALQNVGQGAPEITQRGPGLAHISFQVPDQYTLAKVYQNLNKIKVNVTLADQLICWSLRFKDPDGNGVEIYWDTRHLPGKADLWQGRELPLEPEKIMAFLREKQQNP